MKKNKWITALAFVIVFVIPLILFAYWFTKERPTVGVLPIYGEKIPVQLKDSLGQDYTDTLYHHISPIHLVNQLGDTLSEPELADKVLLVSFGANQSAVSDTLMKYMGELQLEFLEEDRIFLLTFMVNEAADSVKSIYQYGLKHGVNHNRWMLLDAGSVDISQLATGQFLLEPETNDGISLLSSQLMLIDKERRIRGYYNGMDPESVAQLRIDTKRLLISYLVNSYETEKED